MLNVCLYTTLNNTELEITNKHLQKKQQKKNNIITTTIIMENYFKTILKIIKKWDGYGGEDVVCQTETEYYVY